VHRSQALADTGDAATAEDAALVAAAAPRPPADDDPEEEYGWEAQNLAHATNYHCMFEPNMLSAAVSALGEADYHAAHGHVLNQWRGRSLLAALGGVSCICKVNACWELVQRCWVAG